MFYKLRKWEPSPLGQAENAKSGGSPRSID